jgi:hypothetical protein
MEPTVGVVQDAFGNPVENALVAIEWASVPCPEIALRTNSKGQFQVTLPPGNFRLAAHTSKGGYGVTDFVRSSDNTRIVIHIEQN